MAHASPPPPDGAIASGIRSLVVSVRGRVIAPDDPDYDAARTVMYDPAETRPAAVVRVADAADVARDQ